MTASARFEVLFRSHYVDVHRYLVRRTDAATAEDVANETFTVCWRRLDVVPDPALPWLYGVARKCLANRRRAEARRARVGDPPLRGRDPADELAERDAILRAFAALGERDREALRLVAWEGLPLADAARVAGTTRAAFATRLHRARRRLAAELDPPHLRPVEEPS
jgi:RNA polymerase sigma factor (sigma-70 family)